MTRRFIKSTTEDCYNRAARLMRARRIRKGYDPDISTDGKPYVTKYAGEITEGLTGNVDTPEEEVTKTGEAIWTIDSDEDLIQDDLDKEVQERDLDDDEFRVLKRLEQERRTRGQGDIVRGR